MIVVAVVHSYVYSCSDLLNCLSSTGPTCVPAVIQMQCNASWCELVDDPQGG